MSCSLVTTSWRFVSRRRRSLDVGGGGGGGGSCEYAEQTVADRQQELALKHAHGQMNSHCKYFQTFKKCSKYTKSGIWPNHLCHIQLLIGLNIVSVCRLL
jgi:hypothetical protein